MKELLFQRPKFHHGTNYTFRRGSSWSELVDPGDFVWVVGVEPETNAPDKILTMARIITIFRGRVKDIPASILKEAHDPQCRNRVGLRARLREIYPGENIRMDSQITALGFRVYEEKR